MCSESQHLETNSAVGSEDLVVVHVIGLRLVRDPTSADGVISGYMEVDENANEALPVCVPANIISPNAIENRANILRYLLGNAYAAGNDVISDSNTTDNVHGVDAAESVGCTDTSSAILSDVVSPGSFAAESIDTNAEMPAHVKVRKRKRNPTEHKKSKKKLMRNTGQRYVSTTGKVCEARKLGHGCSCRKRCFETLTENHCQFICSQFWKLGDFNQQNAYLFGQIKCYRPIRRRPESNGTDLRKQYSYAYYVKSASDGDIRICKEAFLSIHGLQKCRGRLENILTQMVAGTGVPKVDSRGKHDNRPNRTPSDVVDCVKMHIRSFPTYQSHYSRRDNINRVYLGQELTISKMHRLYMEIADQKNWPRVSVEVYRRIFCENFNMGFRLPQTDTCKVCDKFNIDIQSASNEADRSNLERQFSDHKQKASSAFQLLHHNAQRAKENPEAVHVICFDLQQALPTPKLSSSPAFYKRKLWTYNFCVHDAVSETASMFVWCETTAGRGSNDIASCILQYLKNVTVSAKTMIVFSDNCSGQNKNFNILSLWQYLVADGSFEEIIHIFPVSGHTMMPCDRDFGDIERKLRKTKCVYTTSEYVEHIKDSRSKNRFNVTEMTADKFVNINAVASAMTKRTVTSDKQKIDFRQVSQFRFMNDKPQQVQVKLSHDDSEEWKLISFQKRGRPVKLQDVALPPLYTGPRCVPKAKADDVKSLLPYVPPIYHEFYNGIAVDNRKQSGECAEILDDDDSA